MQKKFKCICYLFQKGQYPSHNMPELAIKAIFHQCIGENIEYSSHLSMMLAVKLCLCSPMTHMQSDPQIFLNSFIRESTVMCKS